MQFQIGQFNFHNLGFDKPLYVQNPIPTMDYPNNYELRIDPNLPTVGGNSNKKG